MRHSSAAHRVLWFHRALCCSALALCTYAPVLHAAEGAAAGAAETTAERRSGFTFGVAGGLLTSSARGYPNDVDKIDVRQYEAHSGLGVNVGGAFWIGGALADWLNVGVGVIGGGIQRDGLRSGGGAFNVRVETFPLFYRGGPFRDLGVLLTAGTGGYSIERGKEKLAEGAGTSAVGLGAFYEPWRLWQFSFGPQLEYNYQFSDSMSAHTFVLGVRTVFYGGP
ncbi:MAG: hypothetical protein ABI895_18160 [Deltaproteobacteria bacterium]